MTPTPATPTAESTTPEPKKEFPHLWEVVGWIGGGMVVGTVLLTFLVLWRFEGEVFGIGLLAPDYGSGGWKVPLLLALIVAFTVFRRDRSELNPDPVGPVTPTFFILLGLSLAILLLVLLGNLPVGSFSFTAGPLDEPYLVDPEALSLWSISVALLFALVLLLLSRRWPRTLPWKRSAAPLVAGVVLALIADPAVRALAEYVPTEHSSLAEGTTGPAPFPSSVTRLGWEWRAPEGGAVLDVERGPLGPVVVLKDGLVGLDGQTGEELWSYRRPFGNLTAAVQPGADRAHVVLHSEDVPDLRNHQGHNLLLGGRATVLNTLTGEILQETDSDPAVFEADVVRPGPGVTVHGGFGDDFWVRAYEVGATEPLWNFTMDTDEYGANKEDLVCWSYGNHRIRRYDYRHDLLVQGDQVLAGYSCADPADFEDIGELRALTDRPDDRFTSHLVALDLNTGEENWSREWAGPMGSLFLRDGGPVLNPGAAPAVIVGGVGPHRQMVLDSVDGSDILNTDQGDPRWMSFRWADTAGAVAYRWEESDPDRSQDGKDEVLERVETSGEVVATARLPLEERAGERSLASGTGSIALVGGVALPFVGEAADGRALSLTVAPFQDVDPGPGETTEGVGVLQGAIETWEEPGRWDGDRPEPRAVLVPGAVVSYASHRGERVYGWQP
ncbi:hypothetical protein NE857_12480 [Nocardiopsis exhalans]|uniref:PQQ-binding-like beta-propeller repeat protein n=1 Tax=Nocardiopsis exhalans TaxID=163604 RepID=A0ABY5DGW6_9ACTN|nr:hypothetical protein [Nocardiopsis exhalans]USY22346.1 hypothetical protein NE857_12480 [Nocardiopsis exhalans]